jgi:hypothetical protein
MRRFAGEGRNAQEGRKVIPAPRRNGEEEAPHGLSFEGGEAGDKTLSRRQALGLLGASLAGFSLLSTGLATPAKSLVNVGTLPLKDGDQIHLECLGDKPGPRWLDGRTQDGTVGLAPNTQPPYMGTTWHITTNTANQPNPDFRGYFHYCEGMGPGDARYLDGRTDAGDVVLSPTTNKPFMGTRWWIHRVP